MSVPARRTVRGKVPTHDHLPRPDCRTRQIDEHLYAVLIDGVQVATVKRHGNLPSMRGWRYRLVELDLWSISYRTRQAAIEAAVRDRETQA